MKIILILLLFGVLNGKEITINITDGVQYTYKDVDNDGAFDSLLIDKDSTQTVIILDTDIPKPNIIEYNESELVLHTKNYSDKWQDAYFRILLMKDSVIIGYYEHFYKRYELIYKEKSVEKVIE